jgi:hypothetical protein
MRSFLTFARHPSTYHLPQPDRPLQQPRPFLSHTLYCTAQYASLAHHPATPPFPLSDSPPGPRLNPLRLPASTQRNRRHLYTSNTMAGWGMSWFGGGQTKKEAPKRAILQLRGQLEMLNKREKHLQNQMEEQDNIARKFVNSNKNGSNTFVTSACNTAHSSNSGEGSLTAEEAVRTLARADERTNNDARTGNLQHRNRQHQQGDS